MVIVLRNGTVNRILRSADIPRERHFCDPAIVGARNAFTSDSSRSLKGPSNFVGHDHPNKPANGVRMIRQSVGGLAIRSCAL